MDKEKVLKLCNAVASYVMGIQRTHGCKVTKVNQKELIKSLIEFGVSKDDAKAIESSILE